MTSILLPLRPLTDSEQERIRSWIPELELLTDAGAKDRCVRVWGAALRLGSWNDPTQAPTLPGIPIGLTANLAAHTGRVMRACLDVASGQPAASSPIDHSVLLESAALHDVAKLVEYEATPTGFQLSAIGEAVHHAAIGAQWALDAGCPTSVAHAIYVHSPQVLAVPKAVEAGILYAVDQIDAMISSGSADGWAAIKRDVHG